MIQKITPVKHTILLNTYNIHVSTNYILLPSNKENIIIRSFI